MEYKNKTYYWILPLNEGKWTLAKHIEGTWHFIDGRCRLTNDLGQTGEEIPSNDELFKAKREKGELIEELTSMVQAFAGTEADTLDELNGGVSSIQSAKKTLLKLGITI